MIRLAKFLALAGLTLGGAFLTTAAQASAANFTVDFAMYNGDSTNSMIRETSPLPSTVTGLINPPSAISPGGYDPASSFATYSDGLPAYPGSKSVQLEYENANTLGAQCTFTIQVKNVGGTNPYVLHFSVSPTSPCSVPGDQSSSTGLFTGSTSILTWKD
jgi:hypothetical protein